MARGEAERGIQMSSPSRYIISFSGFQIPIIALGDIHFVGFRFGVFLLSLMTIQSIVYRSSSIDDEWPVV